MAQAGPQPTQQPPAVKANYQLAARFSSKKLEKMIFSTTVDPHWLKKSDRFWYMYETTEGKKWYIVDPAKGERQLMFDNDKMAAAISRIVKDPFDAKHLGLDSLKFIKDENWIQFEVEEHHRTSTQKTPPLKKTPARQRPAPAKKRKRKSTISNITSLTGPLPN